MTLKENRIASDDSEDNVRLEKICLLTQLKNQIVRANPKLKKIKDIRIYGPP
jgi:hypothetical protein